MTSMLRLRLLGTFEVWLDGTALPVLPSRHARALLARLALAHPQPIRRRQLLVDLFPETAPERALPHLRTILHAVRHAAPTLVRTAGDMVLLDSSIHVEHDVAPFERGTSPDASDEERQRELTHYHEPFLGGTSVGWSADYALVLRGRFLHALQQAYHTAQASGKGHEALHYARQWTAYAPDDEAAHQALVAALIAQDARAEARAAIATARRVLAEPRGYVPSPFSIVNPIPPTLPLAPEISVAAMVEHGKSLRERGDSQLAEGVLRQAIARAMAEGATNHEALAHLWLAYALDDQQATPAAVMDEFQRALAAATMADDQATVMRARLGCAYAQMRMGQVQDAFDALQMLASDPVLAHLPWQAGAARRYLGIVGYSMRHYEYALTKMRESIFVFDAAGERYQAHMSRGNLLNLLVGLGQFEEALLHAEINVAEARLVGAHVLLWEQLVIYAYMEFMRGEAEHASILLEESLAVADAHGVEGNLLAILGCIAMVAEHLGRHGDAQSALRRLEHVRSAVDPLKERVNAPVGTMFRLGDRARAVTIARARVRDITVFPAGELLPIWGVYALWDAAMVLVEAEAHDTARETLDYAYARMVEDAAMLPPNEMRQEYCTATPAHRALMQASASYPRVVVYLPSADAPTGRALQDDEQAPVIWTLDSPDDQGNGTVRRRQRLRRLIHEAADQGAVATVERLAAALSAGQRTIQRDLHALRDEGVMVETRGNRGERRTTNDQ